MLFAGQYEIKLERKKRIALPKLFLKSLEKQSFNGVFLFPSLNGKYIEACGEAWLAYWSRKMDEQGILNQNDVLISNILDNMTPCEADKSGRIGIPFELAEKYELQTHLILTGRGFRFQIWNKDAFLAYRDNMKKRCGELLPMEKSKMSPAQLAERKKEEAHQEKEVASQQNKEPQAGNKSSKEGDNNSSQKIKK